MRTNTPDPWWDFCDRNDRIVALAALSPGRGRIAEDDDLRQLKTTGATNMILTETTKAQDTTNKWHGKVTAGAVVAAWWPTTATVAVVEVAVGDVLRLLVHVNRSKSGKHYAAPPASKRGDSWLPHFEFADPSLGKEVERVAVAAVEAALLAKVGAPAQPEDDPDEMPF